MEFIIRWVSGLAGKPPLFSSIWCNGELQKIYWISFATVWGKKLSIKMVVLSIFKLGVRCHISFANNSFICFCCSRMNFCFSFIWQQYYANVFYKNLSFATIILTDWIELFQRTGSSMQEEVETSTYDAVAGIAVTYVILQSSLINPGLLKSLIFKFRVWIWRECVRWGWRRNEHVLFAWSLWR